MRLNSPNYSKFIKAKELFKSDILKIAMAKDTKALKKVKQELLKISKDFGLDYNINTNILLLSMKEKLLRDFVGGCPDPEMNKFGIRLADRIKNIEAFSNSDLMKKRINGVGGAVVTNRELENEINYSKKIKNTKLRKLILNIYKKLQRKFVNVNKIIILGHCKTASRDQIKFLYNIILKHELIHILLISNSIYFQKINSKHWTFDEGLVTYIDYFENNKLNKLNTDLKETKDKMLKIYLRHAVIFNKILKNKSKPSERKQAIMNFYKKLMNLK